VTIEPTQFGCAVSPRRARRRAALAQRRTRDRVAAVAAHAAPAANSSRLLAILAMLVFLLVGMLAGDLL
jgi:hypothetical protein